MKITQVLYKMTLIYKKTFHVSFENRVEAD